MVRLNHPFLLKVLDRVTISIPRRLPGLSKRNDLRGTVRRLMALKPGELPGDELLADLRFSWGNAGYSPSFELLEHTAKLAVETPGPVLECGAGVTTLLLGALAGKRGVEVWSLENDEGWHRHMTHLKRVFHLEHVRLIHAPIRRYGLYSWYDISRDDLPEDIRLVICDGPPRETPGGRYGLIPVVRDCMSDDCVIVLDDTHRKSEQRVMRAWSKRRRLRVREIGASRGCSEICFA